jgi:hypothetical protein
LERLRLTTGRFCEYVIIGFAGKLRFWGLVWLVVVVLGFDLCLFGGLGLGCFWVVKVFS